MRTGEVVYTERQPKLKPPRRREKGKGELGTKANFAEKKKDKGEHREEKQGPENFSLVKEWGKRGTEMKEVKRSKKRECNENGVK